MNIATELKETYFLSDLLVLAGKGFSNNSVRKIVFLFADGVRKSVEYMDSRTNKIRYTTISNGRTEVHAYSDLDKTDVLMREVEKDIRSKIALFLAMSPESRTCSVELHLPGELTPVKYKSRPGGFSYNKVNTP